MNIPTTFSALVFVFGALNSINATSLATKTNFPTVDDVPAFYANGKDICIDENFTVPVTVTDFNLITSFQFTIGWDNSLMNFDSISSISPTMGNTLLFNEMSSGDVGVLTVSWYDTNVAGVTVDDFTEVFHINFTAVAENQTNIDISFEDTPTMKEVSGYINNEIEIIDAIYNEGEVNVDQQEMDSYEEINDVNNASVGGVNITVKYGTTPYQYVWSNDSEEQNLTNVGVGDYSVTVTDNKGCQEIFGPFTVDNTVNVNDITSLRSIGLYPNPANDRLHINATFENVEDLEISIYNILGEIVYSQEREAANLDMDLDISTLSEGNYFLQLKTEVGTHTEKLEIIR